LVNNPDRQWYFIVPSIGYLIIAAVLLLALFSFGRFQTKQDENISYIVLPFLALLAYLVFFLNNNAYLGMVRYGVLLEYWYVLIAALFFYLLYCLLKTLFRGKYFGGFVLVLLFFGLFVNYPSLSKIINFKGGISEITRETHMIGEPAYELLIPLVKNNDVILTIFFQEYDELHQNKFKEIKILPYNDFVINKSVDLQKILQLNPSGWIVLPDNKTFNIPYSDFNLENATVDYLGSYGDLNIWHWFITD
jgi:FlaA1/EpsC-like NDP-sugar epimerase